MKYNYILSLPTCGNKVFLATLDFWRIFKTQSHTTVKVNLQKRPRERKNTSRYSPRKQKTPENLLSDHLTWTIYHIDLIHK